MENILFIAYQFPPLNLGGTQRPLKFVKYLGLYKINPIVLTLSQDSYSEIFSKVQIDNETLNEIPKNIIVERIKSDKLLSNRTNKIKYFLQIYFNLYGVQAAGWRSHVLKKIPHIIKKYSIKAVFVTAPPFSVLPIALEISKKYNLPLITDMRDAWSQWCTSPYASYFHYRLTLKKERRLLKKSSAVIATSKQTISDFQKHHKGIKKENFYYIPNGFDLNLDSIPERISVDFVKKEKVIIGYVGSFYYSPHAREQMFKKWYKKKGHRKLQYTPKKEDWLYRSPFYFFKTVQYLLKKYSYLKSKILIRFAGIKPAWMTEMVKSFNLENNCEFLGLLSLKESIEFQKSCDALFITSSKVIGGKDYSIAGKTFEYMTMKKLIIAFVADGAQKEILQQSGLAIICNPDNTIDSAENLKKIFETEFLLFPKKDFIKSFYRKNLTKQLAQILNQQIKKHEEENTSNSWNKT